MEGIVFSLECSRLHLQARKIYAVDCDDLAGVTNDPRVIGAQLCAGFSSC